MAAAADEAGDWSVGDVGSLKVKDILPKTVPGACCCCCSSVVTFILIILFFPCTVTQLGQYKLGLAKNKITGVVDMEQTYLPGRYWIGFWKEFIEFPSILYTIEFSDEKPEEGVQHLSVLRSRDHGGHQMFLDISIQYQLIPDQLGQIYREMTTHYEDVYISELRDALSKAGNRFDAELVWKDYEHVTNIMKKACDDVLILRHATCWGLQLWGVRLQAQYESQLVRTEVQKQAQKTGSARLLHEVYRANTTAILAEYKRNITIIRGQADAQIYRIQRDAQAKADARIIGAHAESLEIVRGEMVANSSLHGEISMNSSQLITYQQIVMLHAQKDAQFVYHTKQENVMESMNAYAAGQMLGARRTLEL